MNFFTPFRTLLIAGIALAAPATVSARVVARAGGGVYISSGGGYCAPRAAYCAPVYGYRSYCAPRAYYAPAVSFGIYSTPYYGGYYGGGYYPASYTYDSYPTRTVYRGVVETSYRAPARYDADLSVDVQRALARRGYYRGEIDGDVGPATRAAIRSYQYNRGLEVTGRIDGSLLRSLNLS
jgi:hypothetical protein